MVVVAIIAILAVVAAGLTAGMRRGKFRNLVNEVQNTLREARNQSVGQGREVIVLFQYTSTHHIKATAFIDMNANQTYQAGTDTFIADTKPFVRVSLSVSGVPVVSGSPGFVYFSSRGFSIQSSGSSAIVAKPLVFTDNEGTYPSETLLVSAGGTTRRQY
jgi:type IV fimbrial biogenesis protein FimT